MKRRLWPMGRSVGATRKTTERSAGVWSPRWRRAMKSKRRRLRFGADCGSKLLHYTLIDPSGITRPLPAAVWPASHPAITYQWYFNGTAISGATSTTYSLSSAQPANAGEYTAAVSNVMGSVTSDRATLTVNLGAPPPSGGSGGGASSAWFCGALLLLAAVRQYHRRTRDEGPTNPAST